MILGDFREFGGNQNDSIVNHFQSKKYENQDKVSSFMRNCGEVICVSGSVKDVLTGEIIGTRKTMRHGDFIWGSDLAYYVDKYNFRPSDSFVEYAISYQ